MAGTAELQGVLNQLAGTTNYDAQKAANVYAGTNGLDLLGALNAKAGTTGLGLDGVCNRLANTQHLSAPVALSVLFELEQDDSHSGFFAPTFEEVF